MQYILGISCYYHDSAAVLLTDGDITCAFQEERFTRKKHDASFPKNAVEQCLSFANIELSAVDAIVFYEDHKLKFQRLISTYFLNAPAGLSSFLVAMPQWLGSKLFMRRMLRKELRVNWGISKKNSPKIIFGSHHRSHAASAFFPSPFKKAAVLCLDGVGEWATTTAWIGDGSSLKQLWQINFPHSLGLLYSAFTYYAGFKVNSGEYKLMGLAPYGSPVYASIIREKLISVMDDGSFKLDMHFFDYAAGFKMINKKFEELFGKAARKPESEITQFYMDIASSIQVITEEIVLKLARSLKEEFDVDYLCLAGGVALNCVANGKLLRSNIFKDIWIQPAAGDSGGAIGAALSFWYETLGHKRLPITSDSMKGAYLGQEYSDEEIERFLTKKGIKFKRLDKERFLHEVAKCLSLGKVVGWFQGRMEFGPRSLGARSILGDPRSKSMQSVMNLKIKFRESFRPFAPAVKQESAKEWFNLNSKSPYMLIVSEISENKKLLEEDNHDTEIICGLNKLKIPRSKIPAVTHVDFSARVQTVDKNTNPKFYGLLDEFGELTQCPILINTSFNVRGEPIVCSPEDALKCFMRTGMDYLAIGNFLIDKTTQEKVFDYISAEEEYALD